MFILPTRSITDYALVRRTISGNENSLWQLDGENITPHPWFGVSKISEEKHPALLQLDNAGEHV